MGSHAWDFNEIGPDGMARQGDPHNAAPGPLRPALLRQPESHIPKCHEIACGVYTICALHILPMVCMLYKLYMLRVCS